MKDGDIFRWSYNSEWLKKKNDGDNGGTTYWCNSRIGVFNDGFLVDTFWSYSNSCDTSFAADMIASRLDVEFIANEDDLIGANPSERAYYLDEDCVDLNHPNSTRGNFYIRKGAKKNIEKMERVLTRYKKSIESSIKFQLSTIKQLEDKLKGVSVDTYINTNDISLDDNSYEDYE